MCPVHRIPRTEEAISWKLSTKHLIAQVIVAIPNFSLKMRLTNGQNFQEWMQAPINVTSVLSGSQQKDTKYQFQTITKYRTSCFIYHWIQSTNECTQHMVDVAFTVLNICISSLDHVSRVSCMTLFMAFPMFTCSWRLLRPFWCTQFSTHGRVITLKAMILSPVHYRGIT
jgi:hypothetical protein